VRPVAAGPATGFWGSGLTSKHGNKSLLASVPLSWRAAGAPPRSVQAAGVKEWIGIAVIHPAEQGNNVITGDTTIRSTKTLAGKQRQLHLLGRRLLRKGMFVFQFRHLPVRPTGAANRGGLLPGSSTTHYAGAGKWARIACFSVSASRVRDWRFE
jgi:hypothetical protein